jgi:hypothetical protein
LIINDNKQVAEDITEHTARKRNNKHGTTIVEEVSMVSNLPSESQTRHESREQQLH